MARTFGYAGKTQAIAATTAQTIVFSSSDFNPQGMVYAHVGFTGAANDIGNVTRVRVKANGESIIDVGQLQLRAFMDRFTRSNQNLAVARAAFTIPFCVPDAETEDKADLCGWPSGAECQIEITTDAAVAAGIAVLAFTRSTVRPVYYPTLIGQPMNIDISQTNASYQLNKRGMVQAIGLNTVGLDRAKLVLSGQEVLLLPGALYLNVATGDLLREVQFAYNGENVTTYQYVKTNQGLRANQGDSYIELTTQATWGGVANELTIWTLVPQSAPQG